jgi:hypothetical protein
MSGDLHPWRIRDVHDGAIGWIQGRLVGEPTLSGPCSKRPCFYYSMLEEDKPAKNRSVSELEIEDDSGRAIIELAGATIQVNYDYEIRHEKKDGSTGPLHREGILGPGELIAVHGHCRWERDPSPQRYGLYRDPLPQRLRVTGTSRIQIWVTERL